MWVNLQQLKESDGCPAAIGPCSQGILEGDFVSVSVRFPIDPAARAFPEGVQAQTGQSLKNLSAILESAGTGLDRVVKTAVFLSDMNDFAAMNGMCMVFFGLEGCFARSAVEVARLPKDALVEIEAIAVR